MLPKYYANYNKSQPKEYWDYDNFEHEWGVIEIDFRMVNIFRTMISMK